MVGAVPLDERRVADVLGEVAAVADADEVVVAVVDDERRHVDERQQLAHVELERRLRPRARHAGRRAVAF